MLANHGFNIHESVGLMCAEVKVPAFTEKKPNFDADSTQKFAHVRIHVQCVIANIIQKYPELLTPEFQ